MEVIKVSPRGYCYGVVDALQVVQQAIKDPHEARLIYPGDGSPGPMSLGRTRRSSIHQSTDQQSCTEPIVATVGLRGVPLPLLSQREVS